MATFLKRKIEGNPGTPYLEEGERIARQLGNEVIYHGPQFYKAKFITHIFEDAAVTGTSFAGETLEEAKDGLIEARKIFKAEPPEFLPESVRGIPLSEIAEAREESGTLAGYTDDISFRAFLGEHTKYWSQDTYNKAKSGREFQIYRAVPIEIKDIHPGAWVTQSKEYAQLHLDSVLRGEGHIIVGTAQADDLIAMSENEFFYAPPTFGGNPMKEPWQMTLAEYKKTLIKPSDRVAWGNHYVYVKQALEDGLPVPAEVLADYPELRTREGNPGNPRHLKLGEKYYYECEECGKEAIGTVRQMPDEVISQIGGGKLAVYLDDEPCKHRRWKLKGLKSGSNPGTPYLEEGERIARQLGNGVIYNGSQMYHDNIYTHFFTDAAVTGTTFACLNLEECKATLIRSRKAFGAAPPTFSEFTPEVQAVIDKWKGQVVKGEPLVESEARREIIRAGKYKLGVGKTDEAIRAIKEGNVYTKPETPVVSEPVAFQKRLEHELKRAGFIAEPKGDNPMAKPEQERLSFHERIFGKGSTPPLERLGGGQVVNDLLPMMPSEGPPLPRVLGLKWPWKE